MPALYGIRTSPLIGDSGYPASPDGDDRFAELLGSTDAIVTSSAINDTACPSLVERTSDRCPSN
jgi:hypothetical protein